MTPFEKAVQAGEYTSAKKVGEGNFGARIVDFGHGERAIVKRVPFATDKARGVPKQTHPERGVSAYLLDRDVLGFNIVPETVMCTWKGGKASAQKFVSGVAPREVVPSLFNKKKPGWKDRMAKFFRSVNLDDMAKGVVLDLVINNCDRHGKNLLVSTVENRLWFIDNDTTFGRYYRNYRNVFHKYLFHSKFRLQPWLLDRLTSIKREDVNEALHLLRPMERDDTWWRIQFVLQHSRKMAWRNMDGRSFSDWFREQKLADDGVSLVYSP